MGIRKRLGEILVENGVVSETQVKTALQSQKTWGGKLGSTLVRMGFCKEEDILRTLTAQLRLPSVDFRKVKVSQRAVGAVPLRVAEKYNVVPVALKEEMGKRSVILAMSDPTNLEAISEIEFQANVNVRPVVATASSIARAIDHYYRGRPLVDVHTPREFVDLSSLDEAEEMVVYSEGQEKRVRTLEEANAKKLLMALIQVLEGKGVIVKEEVAKALNLAP